MVKRLVHKIVKAALSKLRSDRLVPPNRSIDGSGFDGSQVVALILLIYATKSNSLSPGNHLLRSERNLRPGAAQSSAGISKRRRTSSTVTTSSFGITSMSQSLADCDIDPAGRSKRK